MDDFQRSLGDEIFVFEDSIVTLQPKRPGGEILRLDTIPLVGEISKVFEEGLHHVCKHLKAYARNLKSSTKKK